MPTASIKTVLLFIDWPNQTRTSQIFCSRPTKSFHEVFIVKSTRNKTFILCFAAISLGKLKLERAVYFFYITIIYHYFPVATTSNRIYLLWLFHADSVHTNEKQNILRPYTWESNLISFNEKRIQLSET